MTATEVAQAMPHHIKAVGDLEAIPCHPLGVRPSGNALFATSNLRDAIGTLNALPDELIVMCLEFLDAASLLKLGRSCKALYAFTRSEDLWKTFLVG
jgi:F-box-like